MIARHEVETKPNTAQRIALLVIIVSAILVLLKISSMAADARPEPMAGVEPKDIVVPYHMAKSIGGGEGAGARAQRAQASGLSSDEATLIIGSSMGL